MSASTDSGGELDKKHELRKRQHREQYASRHEQPPSQEVNTASSVHGRSYQRSRGQASEVHDRLSTPWPQQYSTEPSSETSAAAVAMGLQRSLTSMDLVMQQRASESMLVPENMLRRQNMAPVESTAMSDTPNRSSSREEPMAIMSTKQLSRLHQRPSCPSSKNSQAPGQDLLTSAHTPSAIPPKTVEKALTGCEHSGTRPKKASSTPQTESQSARRTSAFSRRPTKQASDRGRGPSSSHEGLRAERRGSTSGEADRCAEVHLHSLSQPARPSPSSQKPVGIHSPATIQIPRQSLMPEDIPTTQDEHTSRWSTSSDTAPVVKSEGLLQPSPQTGRSWATPAQCTAPVARLSVCPLDGEDELSQSTVRQRVPSPSMPFRGTASPVLTSQTTSEAHMGSTIGISPSPPDQSCGRTRPPSGKTLSAAQEPPKTPVKTTTCATATTVGPAAEYPALTDLGPCQPKWSGPAITTLNTTSQTCSNLVPAADKAPLIPSLESAMLDSPISPIHCGSIFGSDAGDGYETPMTSPESSPEKVRPLACRFPRLEAAMPQLDGSHASYAEDFTDVECEMTSAASTLITAESADEPTSRQLEDVWEHIAQKDSLAPSDQSPATTLVQSDVEDFEDETPLGPASPAKGARAFPFPEQSVAGASAWSPARQRQPSALLHHCERNASSRQRRLMTGGLRTPDRFITGRPNTPAKQALLVSRPSEKLNTLQKRTRMRETDPDPFSPAPSRSIRMAEQFATLRGPPPVSRGSVGRAGTVVDDAHRSQRTAREDMIWHVGGTPVTEGVASITNGRGGRVTSGTNAPHYTADFLRKTSITEDEAKHGRRLALAMDIDQSAKVLSFGSPSLAKSPDSTSSPCSSNSRVWRDSAWQRDGPLSPTKPAPKKAKEIPIIPFRVLDAPALRDDYYCSLLAYSATVQCLAIGLGPHVYLWSETRGAAHTSIPDSLTAPFASHVTSISFSSTEGGSAVLAIGRADGRITLWSPLDREARFDSEQPAPVSCVLFRPTPVRRTSVRDLCSMVCTEELLVGDEVGNVYFYSVEWPNQDQRDLFDWHGSMTLLARVSCHSQQVCGLAWSPDGEYFATGGNDNQLFLFETKKILKPSTRARGDSDATVNVRSGSNVSSSTIAGQGEVLIVTPGQHKHVFAMNAAVKAIAFAPWQPSLLAAGGGSNDRCIHFFHTLSGASLATIDCHAQVTSLVWSEKRKEIAATFGFAQPEHAYRVAVFTWPACRMVVGIPWWSEERALYAVAYPRGPSGGLDGRDGGRVDAEGRPWYGRRTREEGCLVVATSDASIKFHEIWAERGEGGKKAPPSGILGGSQILEGECSFDIERAGVIR